MLLIRYIIILHSLFMFDKVGYLEVYNTVYDDKIRQSILLYTYTYSVHNDVT